MIGRVLSTLVTLLAIFCLTPAWADEKGERGTGYGKGHGAGYGSHRMVGHHGTTGHYLRHLIRHQKEIGLTDEQVAKLKAIQLDLDKTRIQTEADIQIAERELAALLENEKSDLSTVEAKVKQSEALQTSLRMAAIKAKRDAVAVLTPEQRKKEQAEHEKMMREHRGGKGGGEHGRKGGGMTGGGQGHPGQPEHKEPAAR